jgi:hypothetical protein
VFVILFKHQASAKPLAKGLFLGIDSAGKKCWICKTNWQKLRRSSMAISFYREIKIKEVADIIKSKI